MSHKKYDNENGVEIYPGPFQGSIYLEIYDDNDSEKSPPFLIYEIHSPKIGHDA